MTTKINSDTSDGLKITSDTSGVLDIQSAGTTKMTVGSTIDIQGNELVLDADADTSIHASTDDQIDFKTGGSDIMKINDGKFQILSTSSSKPNIEFLNDNDDAGCVFHDYKKDSDSPADNDPLSIVRHLGNNDNSEVISYVTQVATASDVSDGTENGAYRIETHVDGTNATRLSINDGGRVSAGTNSPAHISQFTSEASGIDLYVGTNGGAKRFAVDQNGQIYSSASTSITSLSDQRLKENIENLSYGLAEIIQLSPKKFNFISTPDIDEYGFIAQDVESILPELVDESKIDATIQYDEDGNSSAKDSTSYKTLKMGDILPVLVKAVQELKAENDSLKARITALESE